MRRGCGRCQRKDSCGDDAGRPESGGAPHQVGGAYRSACGPLTPPAAWNPRGSVLRGSSPQNACLVAVGRGSRVSSSSPPASCPLAVMAAVGDADPCSSDSVFTSARLGISGVVVLVIGFASLAAGVAAPSGGGPKCDDRAPVADARVGGAAGGPPRCDPLVDSPIAPDGSAYQDLAVRVMDEGFFFANRPTGYPFLLAPHQLIALGNNHLAHELLNLAFALAGGWLLFDLVRPLAGRQAAILALIAYAIPPGLLLLTPVRLTDTVFATSASPSAGRAAGCPAAAWSGR